MSATVQEVLTSVLLRTCRPYQLGWLGDIDRYPWTALLGARQIGKDRSLSIYVVCRAIAEPGLSWNTFSASARHAKQWLRDAKLAYRFVSAALRAANHGCPPLSKAAMDNVTALELPNGSLIQSHASTEGAAVGLRGSVLLNEVGVLRNAEDMFKATYPIVQGALDNGIAAKMIIVSNASRRGTWWHRWWTGEGSRVWHKITTTWSDAMLSAGWSAERVAAGVADRIARLGQGGYAQWYACQWRSASEGYLPAHILDRQTYDPAMWSPPPGTSQVIGMDVGRHVDPSAWCRLLMPTTGIHNKHHVALHTEVRHKMPYAAQREHLRAIGLERRTTECVIDSTGSGNEMAESAMGLMPFPVSGFNFGSKSKQAIFILLRSAFQEGRLWIPASDTDLRMELESLTAHYHEGGRMSIKIPREGGCHGDRAVALALAEHGAHKSNSGFLAANWANLL